ncbi:hypothetical protein HDU91_004451, partial [Kappamyces sp. JEL0680]
EEAVEWPYANLHVLFLFIYLVATAVGVALVGMMLWQGYLIGTSQTSVEFQINAYQRSASRSTGHVYRNEYDLGTLRNFKEFFGISSTRRWYTVLIPWPYPPKSDGTRFPTVTDLFRDPQHFV